MHLVNGATLNPSLKFKRMRAQTGDDCNLLQCPASALLSGRTPKRTYEAASHDDDASSTTVSRSSDSAITGALELPGTLGGTLSKAPC